MEPAGSFGTLLLTNPLALQPVLARILEHLDNAGRKKFRVLGKVVLRLQESEAEVSVPGCCFLASACRAVANEAVRCIRVRLIA